MARAASIALLLAVHLTPSALNHAPWPAVIADPGLEPFPEPGVLSPHSSPRNAFVLRNRPRPQPVRPVLGPFLLADEAQLGTSERPGIGRNHAGHGDARNVLRPPPASAMKPTAACARSSAVMPASHDLGHCCRTQQTPAARLGQRRWSADPMPHWRRCSLYLIAQTKKTRDRLAPRLLSPERIEPMPVVDLRMSSTRNQYDWPWLRRAGAFFFARARWDRSPR